MATVSGKLETPQRQEPSAPRIRDAEGLRAPATPRTVLLRQLGNLGVRALRREPFSLRQSLDPGSLPIAALEGEIRLIRDWLAVHLDGPERAALEETVARFEQEARRRREPPPAPPEVPAPPVPPGQLALDVENATPAANVSGIFLVQVAGKRIEMTAAQLEAVRRGFHQALAASLDRVDARVAGGLAGHRHQARIREDQAVVSRISDFFGRADFPPPAIWDEPGRLTAAARAALAGGQLVAAAGLLERAEASAASARDVFNQYWHGTLTGAGRAVRTLEITRDAAFTANAVLAAVATGGASAGAAGLIAAGTPLVADVAQKATEVRLGLRDRIDWVDVGVTALLSIITARLGARVGDKLFARLAGNPAVVSIGRRTFARITNNLIIGRGSAAFQTALTAAYDVARGRPITLEQFLDLLADQIFNLKEAFLDVVLGEISHRAETRRAAARPPAPVEPLPPPPVETPLPAPRETPPPAPAPRETPPPAPREPAAPVPSPRRPLGTVRAVAAAALLAVSPLAAPARADVPRPPLRRRADGRMFHSENGRELVVKDGLIRYKTGPDGRSEGSVCFPCNPQYYELRNGHWQRRPGVELPGEVRSTAAVDYESIRNLTPVAVDPRVPATRLGLDATALSQFGPYLDASAVARVSGKVTVDQIKGQLAEEIVNRIGSQEAATVAPVRGGVPTFFRGDEVSGPAPTATTSGAEHAPLTDGIIGETYRSGGKLKLFIHRIYESKAGHESAQGLPAQAELDFERIRELGISVRMRRPDGTVGQVKFEPDDVATQPRSRISSVVHGVVPSDVRPATSRDVTKAYTPRRLPGNITEGDLLRAALLIHRRQAEAGDGSARSNDPRSGR